MKKDLTGILSFMSLLFFLLFPISADAVVYVDVDNGKGPWDGNSWTTAYRTVQEGLGEAQESLGGAAKKGEEVWVAEGTYTPTSTTDRSVSIELRPGVALYGGFEGDETELGQRDWQRFVTTLSGDVGVQDVSTDNSYHVVVGADDALIDGFTVTGGYADGTGPEAERDPLDGCRHLGCGLLHRLPRDRPVDRVPQRLGHGEGGLGRGESDRFRLGGAG